MSGGARGLEDGVRAGEEHDEGRRARRRLELSGTQVIGAMLATMTGTLFASKLGVLGTVAGAAVMSVASTVGTAVYQYYLRRGRERLRDARHLAETASLRQATRAHRAESVSHAAGPATSGATSSSATSSSATSSSAAGPGDDEAPTGEVPSDEALSTEALSTEALSTEAPSTENENASTADEAPGGRGWRRSWKLYAAMAVGVFALVMGGVTVYEAIVGKPLSAVVNGDNGSGTSLGDLGGGPGTTTPPDVGETTVPTPEPDSTGQSDDGGTETTPRPDESTPSDEPTGGDTEGGSGGGDSTEPTPAPSSGEQTPAPGDDGALGDTPGDGQAPDAVTPPSPSAALNTPGG